MLQSYCIRNVLSNCLKDICTHENIYCKWNKENQMVHFQYETFWPKWSLAKISSGGSVHVSKRQAFLHGKCTVNYNELSLSTLILLLQDKYMQCKQYLHLTIFKFDFLDFLFYLCKIQFICWLLLVYGFFLVNLNIQQKRWESYYFRSVPLICHLFSLFWP